MHKHKHLTREQEKRLIGEYRNTTSITRKRQIEDFILSANHNFIYGMAKRHSKSGLPMDDLVAEGYRGALHALREFDADRAGKLKFITYAAFWMRHYMSEATYSNATMRVPVARAKRIQTAIKRDGADMLDFCNEIDKSALTALFGAAEDHVNSDGERLDQFMIIKSEDDMELDMDAERVRTKVLSVAKEILTPLQFEIMAGIFMIDDQLEAVTLKDIAKKTKFNIEHIRRHKQIAIRELKRDVRLAELFEELVEKDYYSELRPRRYR